MDPIYFKDQYEFRNWLEENHDKESEVLVGYYKVKSGKPTMTWSESVDQALCFGWIDGIRRSIDEERYCIRFTPRKAGSNWSNINIKKVDALKRKGLMKSEGLMIFNKRKKSDSSYSFERDKIQLSDDLESIFKGNTISYDFFFSQAPSYRRTMIYWIMSAKQEDTRVSRLNKLIKASESNKKLFQ
jgi:uncharacterized protein YdeI (YjbR/CyaY-like superfamily)